MSYYLWKTELLNKTEEKVNEMWYFKQAITFTYMLSMWQLSKWLHDQNIFTVK